MILSYGTYLKGVIPDYAPYIDQHFSDQSEDNINKGLKRFVNSLKNGKLFQIANQIDEWKRNHTDESVIKIVELLRESIKVKTSSIGLFILSHNPRLVKVNGFVLKEAIEKGLSGNGIHICNQIKENPEWVEKTGKILAKLKKERAKEAQDFCVTLCQNFSKDKNTVDKAITLLRAFQDFETVERLYEFADIVNTFHISTKETSTEYFQEQLRKAFPRIVKPDPVLKKEEIKTPSLVTHILFATLGVSLLGSIISFWVGAALAITGVVISLLAKRYEPKQSN